MTIEDKFWIDSKGRKIEITSMSDKWLNNIRKSFNGVDRNKIQSVMDEIKRRKQLNQKK